MPSATTLPEIAKRHLQSGGECRVWERYPCDVPGHCQPVAARGSDDLAWSATVKDISAGGVGLVAVRRFEPGTALAVAVRDGDGDETFLAKVVHVSRTADGKWLLGCAFVTTIGEDEVTRLARRAAADQPPGSEPEFDLQGPGPDGGSGVLSAQQTVLLSDVRLVHAATGARRLARNLLFRGRWPAAGGTVLRLWLDGRDDDQGHATVRVDSLRREGDHWVLTYTFLGRHAAHQCRRLTK